MRELTPEDKRLLKIINEAAEMVASLTYGGIPCDPKPVNNKPGLWIRDDTGAPLTEEEKEIVRQWYEEHKDDGHTLVIEGKPRQERN